MPFQKSRGDQSKIPVLEKGVDSLKRGLKATMDRLDQFLSHQKKDRVRLQEIQQALDGTEMNWPHGRCTSNNSSN